MFKFFMIIFMIIFVIFVAFFGMNFKNYMNKEKLSPFECGFDPFSLSRVPFSLKFFFIAIIFLIFDVEIIIILPFPLMMFNKNLILIVSFILINSVILLGLLYEWKSGMIDWVK